MTRSDYEERQEARKRRLLERAAQARAEATQAQEAADRIASFIPPGQPILVGHHSEKRHRRDLERIDRGFRKAHEGRRRAHDLERRAEAVGTAGVSSDDSEAVAKLHAKLDDLEREQERRKALNAAWRKAGRPAPNAGPDAWRPVGEACGLSENEVRELRLEMAKRYGWQPDSAPFPSYAITNTGAEIRRIKARIRELEQATFTTPREEDHGACRLVEDPDDNRIRILFQGKPAAEVRALLKSFGFRWSPQASAWQRHLNDAGRIAARAVIKAISDGGQR